MEKNMDFRVESRFIQSSSYRYIFPPMIGLLFAQCAPMVDSVFISGTLGAEAFSATATLGPLVYSFNIVAALLGIGCAVVISRCSGSGEKETAAHAFTRSLILMVITTLILSAAAMVLIDPLLHLLCATPENFAYAREYALAMLPGGVFIVLNFAGDYILANDNNKNLAVAGDIAGAVVNMAVDYVGLYLLRSGIWVAGFGTAFGSLCCCLVYSLHFRKKDRLCRFVSLKRKTGCLRVSEIIKPGVPVAIMYFLSCVELLIRNFVLSRSAGTSGLSNSEVIENLYLILSILIVGVSNAVYPMAAAYHGEQNRSGMLMVKRSLVRTGFLILLVLAGILFAFPQAAILPYRIQDPVVLNTLPSAIRIVAGVNLIAMINMVMINYLAAVEKEKKANLTMLIWYAVQIPLILVFSPWSEMNAPWYAAAIAQVAVLVYLTNFCDHLATGLRMFHRENLLLLRGGKLDPAHVQELENAAGEILPPDRLELVKEKMFRPILAALPGGVSPAFSFTILERTDGRQAVILRYASRKDDLEAGPAVPETGDGDGEEAIPPDTCIRSEFLGMRRLMMVLSGQEEKAGASS